MIMVEMTLEDMFIIAKRDYNSNDWNVQYGTDSVMNYDLVTMTDEQFAAMMYLAIGGDDNNIEMYNRLHPMVRDCQMPYRPVP